MTTKIFVGNIANGVTNDILRSVFEHYGTVTECDVLGNFGFVHMESEAEAKVAIADLKGNDLHGQPLKVELSTISTQGKNRSLRASIKIFVGNIRVGTTSEQLREAFEAHGRVSESDVVGSFGFVHMSDEREALVAIRALNGSKLNGNYLNVEMSTKDTQGKARGQDGFGPTDSYGYGPSSRGRGGAGWSYSRGRGRGGSSSRFDPYSAPYDVYHPTAYRGAGSLMAPPAARAAVSSGEDASFARELLQLYTKDPEAFDAYARNPDVRRSLNLQPDPTAMTAGVRAPREDPYLKAPSDYFSEQRLQQRLLTGAHRYPGGGIAGVGGSHSAVSAAAAAQHPQLYMSFE